MLALRVSTASLALPCGRTPACTRRSTALGVGHSGYVRRSQANMQAQAITPSLARNVNIANVPVSLAMSKTLLVHE